MENSRLTMLMATKPDQFVEFKHAGIYRRLGLADNRLVTVEAEPGWDGMQHAASLAASRAPLAPWQLALFSERGCLFLEPLDARSSEIVCQCRQVTRSRLARLVGDGLGLDELAARTGAGTVCGGCVPLIAEIAGSESLRAARLLARESLGAEIARFVVSADRPLGQALPGANILVEVEIDGRRLTRSYTLTALKADGTRAEIIVRREPNGIVSRWLHDHARPGCRLRVSAPLGGGSLVDGETLILLSAGIGITPAFSRLEALRAGAGGRLLIHWSARFARGCRLLSEVYARAEGLASATLMTRDTAQQGRMQPKDWAGLAPPSPRARIAVCGPLGFEEAACDALREAGWPADRINRESFLTGPGAPPLRRTPQFDYKAEPVIARSFHLEPTTDLRKEAAVFLRQFYFEHGARKAFELRMREVDVQIARTGTYEHTFDELSFGARLAWRNSTRCIGRFFWRMLQVTDARHLETEEAVFSAVLEHIRRATNGGDLRPSITVFRAGAPGIRILSPQLILYAGYRQSDGGVIGDPKSAALTEYAQSLGWRGRGTRFDVLPVIIRIGSRRPRVFELSKADVLEVALSHPDDATFASLGLQWFALPAVADMALDVGGIQYTAAPSSGFYMGTEIGAFNLADPKRYGLLPEVARVLGIATGAANPLWRDQALVELNRAVLHSFRKAGVRILDHHTLSELFERFRADEAQSGRPVYGHWPWLVPPLSANLSDIWHNPGLRKVILKPNYFYQPRNAFPDDCVPG